MKIVQKDDTVSSVEDSQQLHDSEDLSPKIQEHKQVALPISMYKHLSRAAFKIKLTTGSGNAGTCKKLHDRSRIRLRQRAGVCACALIVSFYLQI